MTRDTKQAFTLSIAVHVLAVAVAFLFGLVHLLQAEEEEPVVFTLVSRATAVSEEAPAPTEVPPEPQRESEPEPAPDLTLPKFEQLRPAPDVTLPEPEPEPPPPPPTPTSAPQPTPKPLPEPKPNKVSYQEWARNRELPERTQRVEPQASRSVEVPAIQTDIRRSLTASVQSIETSDLRFDTARERDAVQSYFAALVSRLKAVFEPIGGNRTARVEFTLQRNGSITDVRLLRGSGDSGFDNSVMQAFQRVRSPGPPPGSPPYTRTLTFKSED